MTKINKEDILEALYEEIIEEMAEKIANDLALSCQSGFPS